MTVVPLHTAATCRLRGTRLVRSKQGFADRNEEEVLFNGDTNGRKWEVDVVALICPEVHVFILVMNEVAFLFRFHPSLFSFN